MVRYTAGNDHGAAVLSRAGYEMDAGDGPVVGRPTGDGPDLFRTDRPVVVEALAPENVDAKTLVPQFANALAGEQNVLFVVPDESKLGVALGILDRPYCVAAETDTRCRTFYNGPDRVPLANGRYALAQADEYVWRELDPDESELDGRTGSDRKEVVLTGDGETVALFTDVDGLSCPTPDAFPFSYGRGHDKQFHVHDRDGREVGRFTSIQAMRKHGYEPVPMPLVPEHLFERGSLAGSWAVVVEDSFRVHTGDGTHAV
ncbi:hypothetical protein [Haloarchaeobius amylolyticus]|uniref:hypothetical protein n=1 Tax=Haloarchaeobius amylolyticus TaxID=1198296 RepID=UPI002271E338|nr:hypothetical protein [Haloarchaeobius amylolyticus]